MGFGGISIWQLLIILAIVLVLFGAKRLRNVGSDLGSAIKGFRKAMREDGSDTDSAPEQLESKEADKSHSTSTPTPSAHKDNV